MRLDEMNSIRVVRPTIFDNNKVVAGFSTRHGGESGGDLTSLNLSKSVNDEPAVVDRNRKMFFGDLGLSVERLALAGQVHGVNVANADVPGLYPDTDGLVTSETGLVLCLTAADCASVLLADESTGVIGACHAGWRGAAGGIVGKTLDQMVALGARTTKMRAYISPCISVENFEVGEEVASQFPEKYVNRARTKPHVDLAGFLEGQLVAEGIPVTSIENSRICTISDDRFFSHRGDGGQTGRMMGCIALVG